MLLTIYYCRKYGCMERGLRHRQNHQCSAKMSPVSTMSFSSGNQRREPKRTHIVLRCAPAQRVRDCGARTFLSNLCD